MTANSFIRPVAGDVFGKLRLLRTVGNGKHAICFCVCQRSCVVAIDDLLAGAAVACARCSPNPSERRTAVREQTKTAAAS